MSNGIPLLSNKTYDLLKQKHTASMESSPEALPQGPFRPILSVAYDNINESLVIQAAMLIKGGFGSSGFDADG